MVFEETELDTSVSAVLEKAKSDIAEQNQDIATVTEQKRQMREYTKKRLLANFEQEASVKAQASASLEQDIAKSPVISPVLERDPQLSLDFDAALPTDESTVISPVPESLSEKRDPVTVPVVDLSEDQPTVSPVPTFGKDEFLALEPGPTIDSMTVGLSEAPIVPQVSAQLPQDPSVAQVVFPSVENEGFSRPGIFPDLEQDPVKAVEVSPGLVEDKTPAILVTPDLPVDEDIPTAPRVSIKNETMDGFFPIPVIDQDSPLSVKATPIIPSEASEVARPVPSLESEDQKETKPEPKVDPDGNYTFIEDLTAKDLDHFFSASPNSQLAGNLANMISENLKPAVSQSSPVSVDLDHMGPSVLPFTGLPPGFASSVSDSGSDSNFGDRLAAGAKEVLFNALVETVTDFIDQALQEYDENFLSFDVTKVLENFLENIQNKDISNNIPIPDRELRLSAAQSKALVDNAKKELRSTYEGGSTEPTMIQLSWQNYSSMLEGLANQLAQVSGLGVSAKDTVGISFKIWNTIVGSLLTNAEYPGKKVKSGINPAVDALVQSGPDFYKNQYDLILVQVDKSGTPLDSNANTGTRTIEELMTDLLGSSMLAVRAAGIQLPEMKSKTVDIPVLWTSVTKAVPHTEVSHRQSLTIDADQYLFMYDTFLKLSGKFYASSKYGLVDPSRPLMANGFTPIQLGSLVAAAWSDSAWGMKLSSKARLDIIVKLRNFSPVLASSWNIAPGLEPYFVFEDVRFLGNGALSLGRSDVSKATFEAEFIYRRMYKVNIDSHSGGSAKYISSADYSKPSGSLVPNNLAQESLASKAGEHVLTQLQATEQSSNRFASLKQTAVTGFNRGLSQATESGTATTEKAKAAALASIEKAKNSPAKLTDIDKILTSMLSAYSEVLATVTGDMTPKYSAAPDGMGNTVGPTEPEFHFKWKKPDLTPIASIIKDAVVNALGAQAQSAATSKAPVNDAKANQMIEKAKRELEGSLSSAKAYSGAQATIKKLSSTIQQEMADTISLNDSATKAMEK